jgi:hypothetical protein
MYTVHGQPYACAGRGARDAMLAGAGFRHDASGAQALGEHCLAEGVVDLVRTGMRKILAFQPDFRAPGFESLGA